MTPKGHFKLTPELLCQALRLPAGTDILGIDVTRDGHGVATCFTVTVTHPDIQEDMGNTCPALRPRWTRQADVRFDGWGQE